VRNNGPNRNHVEARSYDYIAPRQCVADDHSDKRSPRPIREANKMSKVLAGVLGKDTGDET
jgi:hypothetical protein